MKVRQFRYSADNLAYLVYGENSAIAVDGGATGEILSFLRDNGLELKAVTNTHTHRDHTCGNNLLLERTDARLIPAAGLPASGSLSFEGFTLRVISTPGHSRDSVCFLGRGFLLSGDTLFNGKVGRCFTGDVTGFLRSIDRLLELPGDTVVFGGYDYVREYMDFARMVEPSSPAVDEYLERYDPGCVCATLDREKRVNPFLRLNEPAVVSYLERKGLPASSRLERFASLLQVGT